MRSSWAKKVDQELSSKGTDRGKESQHKVKSILDNFDISKIANAEFKLEYVNPECYNNQMIGEIYLGDISSKIECWQTAVVCYVLGAHPTFAVMNGFIQQMWGKYEINKVAMMKNEIVMVRFDSEKEKLKVLEGGIYHFDDKSVIVKTWSLEMKFSKEELLTIPI